MNNIVIKNKTISLPNPVEMESFATNLNVSQDEYSLKLKKDIESLYYSFFKNYDYDSRLRFFINSQVLVDKSYEYLLNETEKPLYDFISYLKMTEPELDKIISSYESSGSYEHIYKFEFPRENEDCFQFFYKFSFSTFFGERYLQNLFDLCPKAFVNQKFNQDEIRQLHFQLKESYKKDYDKAYNLFKSSL